MGKLKEAIKAGNKKVLEDLLKRKTFRGGSADEFGNTPLLLAASLGRLDMCQLLLGNKSDAINTPNHAGYTPTMLAAERGYGDVVDFLVSKGANLNSAKPNGATALMLAAAHNREEIVKVLLSKGANADLAKKDDGFTAAMFAAQEGHIESLRRLVEHKVDPNITHKSGWTALTIAAQNGHGKCVEYLCRSDALVDNRQGGWTPLAISIQEAEANIETSSRWLECGEILLKHGANINASNFAGLTMLHLAAARGSEKVIEWLLERGADPMALSPSKQSPEMIARGEKHDSAAERLAKAARNFEKNSRGSSSSSSSESDSESDSGDSSTDDDGVPAEQGPTQPTYLVPKTEAEETHTEQTETQAEETHTEQTESGDGETAARSYPQRAVPEMELLRSAQSPQLQRDATRIGAGTLVESNTSLSPSVPVSESVSGCSAQRGVTAPRDSEARSCIGDAGNDLEAKINNTSAQVHATSPPHHALEVGIDLQYYLEQRRRDRDEISRLRETQIENENRIRELQETVINQQTKCSELESALATAAAERDSERYWREREREREKYRDVGSGEKDSGSGERERAALLARITSLESALRDQQSVPITVSSAAASGSGPAPSSPSWPSRFAHVASPSSSRGQLPYTNALTKNTIQTLTDAQHTLQRKIEDLENEKSRFLTEIRRLEKSNEDLLAHSKSTSVVASASLCEIQSAKLAETKAQKKIEELMSVIDELGAILDSVCACFQHRTQIEAEQRIGRAADRLPENLSKKLRAMESVERALVQGQDGVHAALIQRLRHISSAFRPSSPSPPIERFSSPSLWSSRNTTSAAPRSPALFTTPTTTFSAPASLHAPRPFCPGCPK